MKFNKEDTVKVKLSGLTLSGTIKKIKSDGFYLIQLEDGNEVEVSEKNIKLVESSKIPRIESAKSVEKKQSTEKKSPKRSTRSPSRRSPARTASPSRRGRASPSPSRKKQTAVITSPPATRSLTSTTVQTRVLKVSLANIESQLGDSFTPALTRRRKLHDTDNIITSSPSVPVTKTLYTHDSDVISKSTDYLLDSEELATNYAEHVTKVNEISKFSDDDDNFIEPPSIKIFKKKMEQPREFGGWLGALILIALVPASTIALHIFCNRTSCTYRQYPDFKPYKQWKTYLDINSFGIYTGFISLIALISKIPYIGRKVDSQPSKEYKYTYRMNGLFSAFFVLGLIVILESFNYAIVNYIVNHYFQVLCSAIIFGFVVSNLLYIGGKFVSTSQLNSYALTDNIIYDFFMGRQINPKIVSLDLKTILLRASYIAILILNSIYLFKSMNIQIFNPDDLFSLDNYHFDLKPTLLLASLLQIIYVFDFLLFEGNLTTTFELQQEGLGYMKVMHYCVYPFLMTSITKALYEHSHNLEDNNTTLTLTAICLVFIAGYILYRGSNSQKNAFRLNPYNNVFQNMTTLQTTQGKKLLISGFWGKVRHPNYLGDILIHLSLSAFAAGCPAALSTLPVALSLTYRAMRDSNRCKQRYSAAWDRYVNKIRYAIIPKVY